MMKTMTMQTQDQLLNLLNDLVSVGSVTLSDAEKELPSRVEQYLKQIPYYVDNPSHIVHHPTSDGRTFLTALYKHAEATKTVVMISHFDVVEVEDYGDLKHLAFSPLELTKALHNRLEELPEDARKDLQTNDWLFGRGTMDMKAGLVEHMSLLEKASSEDWKINLLLLTVPDEEVNSVGMREAVPKLIEIAEEYDLMYTLFLNSEPMFSQVPGDQEHYFYSGSIGKIMPGALCYGLEGHVGEPLSIVNAGWMSSVLTAEVEWNEKFCETVKGQQSPPPTLLLQRDLKKEYSVQIPHRSVSLYNLFVMKNNPSKVMDIMKEVTEIAAKKMEDFMESKYDVFQVKGSNPPKVRVLLYEDLVDYAVKKTTKEYIATIEKDIISKADGDSRDKTIALVDELSILCQELSPMIVLFYAPPYYPAVNSGDHPLILDLQESVVEYTKERFGYEFKMVEYFNGISDLSYASLQAPLSDMNRYVLNLPGGDDHYSIPFQEMSKLTAPVINVGVIGKDPHKKTERLYLPFAFEQLPKVLEHLLLEHMKQ